MTTKKTEQELREYAEGISKTIVIRIYNDGNSFDTRRESTQEESKIIMAVIFGALLTVNNGGDIQVAADTAEYTGNILLRDIASVNGYDSYYLPIKEYCRANQ